MEASVVDLRYKMNNVLKALDGKEKVTTLYRGTLKKIACGVLWLRPDMVALLPVRVL